MKSFLRLDDIVKENLSEQPKRLTGIVISVGSNKNYKLKDIAECNSREFLTWLQGVWPMKINKSESHFDSVRERLYCIDKVTRFYSTNLPKPKNPKEMN